MTKNAQFATGDRVRTRHLDGLSGLTGIVALHGEHDRRPNNLTVIFDELARDGSDGIEIDRDEAWRYLTKVRP